MSLIMPGHQGPVSAAEVVDCQLIICCFSTLRLLRLTFPSLLLSSADWEHFSSCWGFQLCPSLGVLATFSSHYLHGSHVTFFLPGRRHKRSLGFWHTICKLWTCSSTISDSLFSLTQLSFPKLWSMWDFCQNWAAFQAGPEAVDFKIPSHLAGHF